jgi:putative membrane protein
MVWLFFPVCLLMCIGMMVMLMRPHGGHHSHWFADGSSAANGLRETPRQVLDRRYASGEINEERYRQMRANLDGGEAIQ